MCAAARAAEQSAGVQEASRDQEQYVARIQAFVEELKGLPIAIQKDRANEQHYEVRAQGLAQLWCTCICGHSHT